MSKYSLSLARIDRWKRNFLVAMKDPGDVDRDVELGEKISSCTRRPASQRGATSAG